MDDKWIRKGTDGAIYITKSGKPGNAIRISCERVVSHYFISKECWFSRKVKVLEVLTYEMACDTPRTEHNFFGMGSYYGESETTGAWWLFKNKTDADDFIMKQEEHRYADE